MTYVKYNSMKSENKHTKLERIMHQICEEFAEFGVQGNGVSIGLGIHPVRIYFNFEERAVDLNDEHPSEKERDYFLIGSDLNMEEAYSMAQDYGLVSDDSIKVKHKIWGFGKAFDLKPEESND